MRNEFTIRPRSLDIYTETEEMISWSAGDTDLKIAIERGAKETGVDLPTSAEGFVLVGLHLDGDDTMTSVVTSERVSVNDSPVQVIDDAIAALKVVRAALAKMND